MLAFVLKTYNKKVSIKMKQVHQGLEPKATAQNTTNARKTRITITTVTSRQLSEMSKSTAAATSTTGMSHNAIVGALVSESYGAGSWKPVLKAIAEARYSGSKEQKPCS